MATMKTVKSDATDDSTGEVREMRTRKEPENARKEKDTISNQIHLMVSSLDLKKDVKHTSIRQRADSHHVRLLSSRQLKRFYSHKV